MTGNKRILGTTHHSRPVPVKAMDVSGSRVHSSMSLNALLPTLIQLSREAMPETFKQKAMEALQTYLPFDSGIWIEGRPAENYIYEHSRMLFRQPEAMMDSYFKNAVAKDFLAEEAMRHPGCVIDIDSVMPRAEIRKHDIYRHHMRHFHIEHALCIAVPDPNRNLFSFISLYREFDGDLFQEPERIFLQQVARSMVESYTTVLWHHAHMVDAHKDGGTPPAAFVDRYGVVFVHTPNWGEALKAMDPSWKAEVLPELFKEYLRKGEGEYLKDNPFYSAKIEPSVQDLWILKLLRRSPLSKLTKTQFLVAEFYAQGMTMKDISQKLNRSFDTIRTHRDEIFKKLNITRKAELINLFHEHVRHR